MMLMMKLDDDGVVFLVVMVLIVEFWIARHEAYSLGSSWLEWVGTWTREDTCKCRGCGVGLITCTTYCLFGMTQESNYYTFSMIHMYFMDQVKATLQPLLCHNVQDYQAVTPQKIHLKHTSIIPRCTTCWVDLFWLCWLSVQFWRLYCKSSGLLLGWQSHVRG